MKGIIGENTSTVICPPKWAKYRIRKRAKQVKRESAKLREKRLRVLG